MSHHDHHSDHYRREPEFQSENLVRIGKFPGTLVEKEIYGETLVAEVLAIAELSLEGYELRINGYPSSIEDRVSPGDTVYLVKPIKGN